MWKLLAPTAAVSLPGFQFHLRVCAFVCCHPYDGCLFVGCYACPLLGFELLYAPALLARVLLAD